jgi:hypothetical protein
MAFTCQSEIANIELAVNSSEEGLLQRHIDLRRVRQFSGSAADLSEKPSVLM